MTSINSQQYINCIESGCDFITDIICGRLSFLEPMTNTSYTQHGCVSLRARIYSGKTLPLLFLFQYLIFHFLLILPSIKSEIKICVQQYLYHHQLPQSSPHTLAKQCSKTQQYLLKHLLNTNISQNHKDTSKKKKKSAKQGPGLQYQESTCALSTLLNTHLHTEKSTCSPA